VSTAIRHCFDIGLGFTSNGRFERCHYLLPQTLKSLGPVKTGCYPYSFSRAPSPSAFLPSRPRQIYPPSTPATAPYRAIDLRGKPEFATLTARLPLLKQLVLPPTASSRSRASGSILAARPVQIGFRLSMRLLPIADSFSVCDEKVIAVVDRGYRQVVRQLPPILRRPRRRLLRIPLDWLRVRCLRASGTSRSPRRFLPDRTRRRKRPH